MRIFFLFSLILTLTSCKPRGFDNPLKIDLPNTTKELCSGNVSREFDQLDNRYVEFVTIVESIKRTHFIAKVRWRAPSYRSFYGEKLLVKISSDEETLSLIDVNKRFKFRGVFKFNSLNEDYCTSYDKDIHKEEVYVSSYEIQDAILIEEITDSE